MGQTSSHSPHLALCQLRWKPCPIYVFDTVSLVDKICWQICLQKAILIYISRKRYTPAVITNQYGSVKGYAVLKTINTGVFIMMPVPLCLTCLDRNFETGFFTTLGLFLWTLSGMFWSRISQVNQLKKREVLVVVTPEILGVRDEPLVMFQ